MLRPKLVNGFMELICIAGEKGLKFLMSCSNIDGLKKFQNDQSVQNMTCNGFEKDEDVVDDVKVFSYRKTFCNVIRDQITRTPQQGIVYDAKRQLS